MQPKRLIVILGTAVFARGEQAEGEQWTVSVWLQDKDREWGEGEPGLVFPTLVRDFDQAFALVAISVRDHLRSARASGPVLPTGFFDPNNEEPRTVGPLFSTPVGDPANSGPDPSRASEQDDVP